jgi:hypothetical protein
MHLNDYWTETFANEFAEVAKQLASVGREVALPMEVVLLSYPAAEIFERVREIEDSKGSYYQVAFHSAEHTIVYFNPEGTFVEINYHAQVISAADD